MGLPQYLARKHTAMWTEKAGTNTELLNVIYLAGSKGIYRRKTKTTFRDLSKIGLKLRYGYTRPERIDTCFRLQKPLALVGTTRFVSIWKDKFGTFRWEGEWTQVQFRYLPKYEKLRAARIEREIKLAEKRNKLLAWQTKVFQKRTFPPTVSLLIWDRDDYTCKGCNRNQEELKRIGRWLTVDHIKEWEDGGPTTMGNGQTLCNICNNAKHHAKKYFALSNTMRNTAGLWRPGDTPSSAE